MAYQRLKTKGKFDGQVFFVNEGRVLGNGVLGDNKFEQEVPIRIPGSRKTRYESKTLPNEGPWKEEEKLTGWLM